MIRAMAKVSGTFSQASNNAKFFHFADRAERIIYCTQWLKNISDLLLFLLTSLEPNYTWIYYTAFVITSNLSVAVMLYFVSTLGKFLTKLMKKNLNDVSSSAANLKERVEEIQRLEDMVTQVRNAEASYLLISWIPGVWWIWTRANFSSNPPMVPRNFFDYFGRIINVWLGFIPGGMLKMFEQTLVFVLGKPEVEEGMSIWIVDVAAAGFQTEGRFRNVSVTPSGTNTPGLTRRSVTKTEVVASVVKLTPVPNETTTTNNDAEEQQQQQGPITSSV
eukprot:TRINITY_DN888_c0_g1_i2.p1 TRINITY_DN888_c0_g1~~TRINITY_DN888_c0_g1_i2.p1  ORF type:complete len:276 (-),score=78.63 TRINITY_DN888_c0_g1_i2:49-876(-)